MRTIAERIVAERRCSPGSSRGHLELIAGCATNVRVRRRRVPVPRGRAGRRVLPDPPRRGRARGRRARARRDRRSRRSHDGEVRRLVVAVRRRTAGTFDARAVETRARDRLRRRLPARQVRGRPRARLRSCMQRFAARAGRAPAGDPAAAARRLWQRSRRAEPARARGPMVPRAVPGRARRAARPPTRGRSSSSRATAAARASRPGQFTMLYAFGVGEVPISISGDPADPARLVHTVRAVGAVTAAICAAEPGRRARRARAVRHGRGRSTTAEGGDVVVVAGGIGLAPLRPAIYQRARATASATAAWSLLYGARTPGRPALPAPSSQRWRGAARRRRRGHRRPRRPRLARRRRRGDRADRRAPTFDPAERGRAGLRARDDDALRRRARCATRGVPAERDLRLAWSAT